MPYLGMREDLHKILAAEIERHVADAFEVLKLTAARVGERYAFLPYLDERYEPGCETLIPHLKRQVCRALAAREWFRQHAPPWSPELPLSSSEIEKLIRSKSNRIAVVGYFAASLATCNWDFKKHPTFQVYAAGALASPYCPDHLRTDPELRKEFPLCPLEELDQSLCWGTHARIVETAQGLMRTEEHWRRCGLSEDAKWMRGVIERITRVNLDDRLRDFLDNPPQ